jgi:g-D-glutamyl-meso-diaminopimelate peptidase
MNENKELDYEALIKELNDLSERYEIFKLGYLGNSLLNRPIPLITLGEDTSKKSVLYVATHHACENICTSVLLRYIKEYLQAYERLGQICQINLRYLFKMRKIYIIPMLNPDGVEYRLNGVSHENPIRDRVISYNGGEDFSLWQANARGVDLNHNYNAGFEEYKAIERERGITAGKTKYSGEYPESEPEISALCSFIRYHMDSLDAVLSLHTQGEEIYYSSGGKIPNKSYHVSKILSRMTKYELSEAVDTASYGGLTDWLIKEYDKPSFTIECGKGQNPLPMSQAGKIYSNLRELLFTFPILF